MPCPKGLQRVSPVVQMWCWGYGRTVSKPRLAHACALRPQLYRLCRWRAGVSCTDCPWHRLHPLKSRYGFTGPVCTVGRKADDRIHPQVGFCFVFPLRVTFASYVLQVDLISSKNRELEHLIICVVLLLCLVRIRTIRGAHRMCFNKRIGADL